MIPVFFVLRRRSGGGRNNDCDDARYKRFWTRVTIALLVLAFAPLGLAIYVAKHEPPQALQQPPVVTVSVVAQNGQFHNELYSAKGTYLGTQLVTASYEFQVQGSSRWYITFKGERAEAQLQSLHAGDRVRIWEPLQYFYSWQRPGVPLNSWVAVDHLDIISRG